MDFQPGVTQKHVLFTLLFTGKEPAMSKTTPALSVKQRKELVAAELITLEKKGRATHIRLTDKAWEWAVANLDQAVPARLKLNAEALEGLLKNLKVYLTRNRLSLQALLTPPMKTGGLPAERSAVRAPAPKMTEQNTAPRQLPLPRRIRAAYQELAGGQWHVRVRIADLKQSLGDVSVELLGKTLRRMQRSRDIDLMLYPCDDPREIGPEDAAAAVDIAGEKNHILYMGA